MANSNPTLTITINEKIAKVLKEGYEEYLEKAEEEPVLTEEEYNLHILKLGILINEIEKKEVEYFYKKSETSAVKSELGSLKNEFRNNRIKIGTKRDFEHIH